MKMILNKILRDIPSSILLMIGFCLTIFITIVSCGMMNRIMMSKKFQIYKYHYYYFDISHTGRVEEHYGNEILSYVSEKQKRITFDDIYAVMQRNCVNFYSSAWVHIGEGQEQQIMLTSVYSFDNTFPFEMKGDKISGADENTVMIGESVLPFVTKMKGEDYLYIDGQYYRVAGIVQNTSSGGYDSSVYYIGTGGNRSADVAVQNEIVDGIMFGMVSELTLYSADLRIIDSINTAKNELQTECPLNVRIENEPANEMTEKDITNMLFDNLNKIFIPILFLFSLGSCYSITSLWVKVRRMDIAVKITYGYGKWQMYCCFMKEIGILLGISLVISVVMRMIYLAIFEKIYYLSDNIVYDIAIISGAMFVTLFVAALGAYRHSRSVVPAEVLKES